ncbi:MAG: NYN domain-containing protein [Candidatus Lambdaproteobacteria bacterium]|nr:NYN domain-containing protein [Candidatus Lambdaproteobacteria bacterium]
MIARQPDRTVVYVDGFNLYYRAVKNTRYKWLDLVKAFSTVLGPTHSIIKVKYFTARVNGRFDSDAPTRQNAYLQALTAFNSNVDIYYGHFLVHPATRRLAIPPHKQVEVLIPEEKGSDVNLAAHLITDAWLDAFDTAFIVTNDSDIAEAVRLIHVHRATKRVGLIVPGDKTRPANQLLLVCAPVLRLRSGVIKASQLPDPIPGTSIRKPPSWN